jgi:hypothetical protein
LPATHPDRAGQALFVTQCLPCHTLNGAGASTVGPDLNQPMNPTEYLTRAGLRGLIRNPKSVRSWPGQLMPGFPADQMSDREFTHDHHILIATAIACWRPIEPSYSWHVLEWLCWKQRCKHPLIMRNSAVISDGPWA